MIKMDINNKSLHKRSVGTNTPKMKEMEKCNESFNCTKFNENRGR